LVDSTGLKLCGPGEWLVEKHATRTRRSWRKLHIGVDADTGEIIAADLTNKDVDDGSEVGVSTPDGRGSPGSRIEPDRLIVVKTETRPIAAALWQAINPNARDFRLEAIGPAYRRSTLEENGEGIFAVRAPEPARGWAAYFVELTFPSGGSFPFTFTTGVRVTPDTLPFGPPPEMAARRAEGH